MWLTYRSKSAILTARLGFAKPLNQILESFGHGLCKHLGVSVLKNFVDICIRILPATIAQIADRSALSLATFHMRPLVPLKAENSRIRYMPKVE